MVRLTRIYTKTGDAGQTHLGDMSRVAKTDPRLIAYADVDEANTVIGVALALGALPDATATLLRDIQNDLFDVGADLCLPLADTYEYEPLRVQEPWIGELEHEIDRYNEHLGTLTTFVLAGGTPGSAYLHLGRTVVRRAERTVWAAIEQYGTGTDGGVNPLAAQYLNRLSDLLFVLARYANRDTGDVLWQPGGGRDAAT